MIRDDYREFIELALVFSGGKVPYKFTFKTPGPVCRARFMQKGIYVLKLVLFSDQIDLDKKRKKILEDLAVFTITCYAKRWMNTTNLLCAPYDDFTMFKDIERLICKFSLSLVTYKTS